MFCRLLTPFGRSQALRSGCVRSSVAWGLTRQTSLEYGPGYNVRIFADADVAFVYSPVILEGPSGTYLIGWGDKSAARNVRGWAKGGKNLHMFFFPAIKVIWLRAIH